MFHGIAADQFMHRCFYIICLLQHITDIGKCFRCDRIEHHARCSDRIAGTEHTKFKLVSGEGKRRSPVAVCSILI